MDMMSFSASNEGAAFVSPRSRAQLRRPWWSLWRYLPLALLATGSVIALPLVLLAVFVPHGGALVMAASAVGAVTCSVAVASLEASLWTRYRQSRDLVFADLLLWGWLRRVWAERGLAQTRELYDSARRAGPGVSIDLLERLSKQLEARDPYTYGHSRRVARHAAHIAKAMHLSTQEIATIRTAAAVHDVGKLYTPREILNNPGRLTEEEFAILKRHSADGAEMLGNVGDEQITAIVRNHHERIDGRGYPDGLSGPQIPLGARIIAVADTFDAITSKRAYRSARTHKAALDILCEESGSQLDADAVAAFLGCYSGRRSVAWLSFASVMPQRILTMLGASSGLGLSGAGVSSLLPLLGAATLLSAAPSHAAHPNGTRTTTSATATQSYDQRAPAARVRASARHDVPPIAGGRSRRSQVGTSRVGPVPARSGPTGQVAPLSAARVPHPQPNDNTTGTDEISSAVPSVQTTSREVTSAVSRGPVKTEASTPTSPIVSDPTSSPHVPTPTPVSVPNTTTATEAVSSGATEAASGAAGADSGATGAVSGAAGWVSQAAASSVPATTESTNGLPAG